MKPKIELFEKLPIELQEFLNKQDGMVLFDGGLYIRGINNEPKWNSLKEVWEGESALYKTYTNVEKTDVPFGQDCVGDQFILRNNIVYKLYVETGEMKCLQVNFTEFIKLCNENPVEYLFLEPLVLYENEGKKLKHGQLLNVYPPFCTKESEDGISLNAIPALERLKFLMSFYKQTVNVSDSCSIKIKN